MTQQVTEPQVTLDVRPREMEVAAVWLPPGARVALYGRPLPMPAADLDFGCYAQVGWDAVSGGCVLMTGGGPRSLSNGRNVDSRPVWDEAAGVLRAAARAGAPPAVVYVVIEKRVRGGQAYLVAVQVRREGEQSA